MLTWRIGFVTGLIALMFQLQPLVAKTVEESWARALWDLSDISDLKTRGSMIDASGRTLASQEDGEWAGENRFRAWYLNGKQMFDFNGRRSLDFFWPNGKLAIHEDFMSGSGGAVQTYGRKEYDEEGREISLWDSPMIHYQPCSSTTRRNLKLNLSWAEKFSLSGQYDNKGRRSGVWRQASAFTWEGEFFEGQMTGPWTATSPHGNEAGSFVDGKRHGLWTISRQSQVETGEYHHGQRQGVWKVALKTNTGSWNDPNWIDSKFQYQFFESGALVQETILDSDGNTLEFKTFSEGKPTGQWLTFFSNGTTRTAAHYLDGLLDGELSEFDASGGRVKVEAYRKGLLEGDSVLFSNGKAFLQSSFVAGSMTARTVLYDAKAGLKEAHSTFKRAKVLRKNAPPLEFVEVHANAAPDRFATNADVSRWLTIRTQTKSRSVTDHPFKAKHILTLPWGSEIGCVGGAHPPYKIPRIYRLEKKFWVVTEENFSIISLNEKGIISLEPYSESRYLEIQDRSFSAAVPAGTIKIYGRYYGHPNGSYRVPEKNNTALLLPLETCVDETCPEMPRERMSQQLGIGSDYDIIQQIGPLWDEEAAYLVLPSQVGLAIYKVTW